MTSVAKIGIHRLTQKSSKAELSTLAPISPTKPHPNMPFQIHLVRKLKTCGRPDCKETIGCEEGCSFTCSYVNLGKPFKIPSWTLLPFLHRKDGNLGGIRLSLKYQRDIASFSQLHLSKRNARNTRSTVSSNIESSEDEKTKFATYGKAAPTPRNANMEYKSPTATDESDEAFALGKKSLSKKSSPANRSGLPKTTKQQIGESGRDAPILKVPQKAPHLRTTATSRSSMSDNEPANRTASTSDELHKELLVLENNQGSRLRGL